jgi:hypothetical protein
MFSAAFMAAMRQDFDAAARLARSDDVRARVQKAKLPLLYLELAQNLGYYSEFGDFIPGRSLGQSRAAKQALVPLLEEFATVCKQSGPTNLGIPITLEKITTKWRSCLEADSPAPEKVYLPAEWIFAADAADKGVTSKWYTDAKYYAAARTLTIRQSPQDKPAPALPAGMARLHANRGVGWEQQGFAGFDGPGWYFQNLDVPAALAARQHLYLHFMGINEQVWFYVNGELAAERTYASTGAKPGDLGWATFSFDAKRWLRPGADNRLALRIMHTTGLGGMAAPSLLIGTDEECTTEQLQRFRY